MADREDTGEQLGAPDDDAELLERREFLITWKLKWSRRLRMRVTDRHIASLIGLTAGSINRKINGRVAVSTRMRPALNNIDTVIEMKAMPDNCPDDLRRGILFYQIWRHPPPL